MPTRRNAFHLTSKEQDAFVNAVTALVDDGTYGELASIHGRMGLHRMHSSHGFIAGMRFLPWHRAYLLEFERALTKKDASTFVPYWDWQQAITGTQDSDLFSRMSPLVTDGGVPDWLLDVTPVVTVTDGPPGSDTEVVLQAGRSTTMGNFAPSDTMDEVMTSTAYWEFTQLLELGPHNAGHMAVGGVMRNRFSPVDPIFWMHHSMVDRLWAEWQAEHPGEGPALSGQDRVMDPWSHSVDSVSSIADLGYSYV